MFSINSECVISKNQRISPPFLCDGSPGKCPGSGSSGRHIIHLEVGEPDFPTAPHICEAACAAIGRGGLTKYTHSQGGLLALREAIVESYYQKFGVDLDPGQVIVTSGGTSPALLMVFMALLEKRDEVIMSNPHYSCYPNFVKHLAGRLFLFTRTKQTDLP